MWKIEKCYKIIFEAILEQEALKKICTEVGMYTNAGIAFINVAGNLVASSPVWRNCFPDSAEKKHLTLDTYNQYFGKKKLKDWSLQVTAVQAESKSVGYVLICFKNKEEETEFEGLGSILAQNLQHFFAQESEQYKIRQPLREHVLSWYVFEEVCSERGRGLFEIEKPYIMALIQRENGVNELVRELYQAWKCIAIYEDLEGIYILFYCIKKAEPVYKILKDSQILCSVSEPFEEFSMCSSKKDMLKRMSMLRSREEQEKFRREKEWSLWGIYTYTTSLFKKAGLKDYSVNRLIEEDEKNHTELYQTLKTYLFCENNVTETAKMMHVHRNTLVYRLKKISDMLQIDYNDYHVSRELLAYILMNDISERT